MEVLKRINRELVKKCHVFSLYQDTVELPDGRIDDYDFIGHKGAAAVVPVTQEGRILMVKQYRNALDRVCLELPAGGRNSLDEPFQNCAARELEEETGYHSDHLEKLISLIYYRCILLMNRSISLLQRIWSKHSSIWMTGNMSKYLNMGSRNWWIWYIREKSWMPKPFPVS